MNILDRYIFKAFFRTSFAVLAGIVFSEASRRDVAAAAPALFPLLHALMAAEEAPSLRAAAMAALAALAARLGALGAALATYDSLASTSPRGPA